MAHDDNDDDFIDELIREGEAKSPGFSAKVDAALLRRVRDRDAQVKKTKVRGR